MATRTEKMAWSLEKYGAEGVYMDGEVWGEEAENHAIKLYDMAHKTGGYIECPSCHGTKTSGQRDEEGTPYACPQCYSNGVVLESTGRPW